MQEYNELVILVAEDDDGHAELINHGLRNSGICNKIIRFSDGEELWLFLTQACERQVRDPNKNYLLLLDINMPKIDGIEVLKRMKDNDDLKKIPVIMLTTTDDPREVDYCYKLGCNVYVTKPVDFLEFTEKLNRLGLFIQIVSI